MSDSKDIDISIVVPVFNEEETLTRFDERLKSVLSELSLTSQVIFVDDGSSDNSADLIKRIMQESTIKTVLLELSRNFGKEAAMTAGLDCAVGDAVILIDADLQDPPELIPRLIEEWHQGYDVVYARRRQRLGETWLKRASASLFYRLATRICDVSIPADTGDFRLLSARALAAVQTLREQHRFMKGLFAWVGFSSKEVLYDRDPRFAGESKWNYLKLWNFAIEGITSFTLLPLKLATYIGIAVSLGAFFYAAVRIVKTIFYGVDLPGYESILVSVLALGGVQLIVLGVIGEYLGRVFNESKRRPLYFLKSVSKSFEDTNHDL